MKAPARAILILLALVIAGLAWRCLRDPQINYLPRDGRAEWILFPTPVDLSAHPKAALDAVFRREFQMDVVVQNVPVLMRADRRFELRINSQRVGTNSSENWKNMARVNASPFLKPGSNVIEARVVNNDGPPSLWLLLNANGLDLRSDGNWQASLAGSAWCAAALATQPRVPRDGNPVFGGETTYGAIRRVWPAWLVFIAVAATIFAGYFSLGFARFTRGRPGATILLLFLGALWIALYLHNARLMPVAVGFDAKAHLNYIKFLQERHAFPLPRDGVQMFQPPLFYIVGAAALSALRLSVDQPSGVLALRALTMGFGIGQFVFAFLTLRLLFPKRPTTPLVGLGFAALLPMSLYLSHYCTNETLAALLVSAAIYQCVRISKTEDTSWLSYILLGVTLAAAALTKFSGYLVLPFVVMALARQLYAVRASRFGLIAKLGVLCLIAVGLSTWHYLRIAHATGSLVLGGWDPASGFFWWQDDGYRTSAYYARFGLSLVRPLFSATASFADGIYSTLWGDGLCGGISNIQTRPPWSYNFMCAGYLLSVFPTLLIVIGVAVALIRFVRKGDACALLLLGTAAAFAGGLIYLSLSVPAHASIKAFYCLSCATPLAYFVALSWNRLTRSRRVVGFVFGIVGLLWAMNSFASVWIRPSESQRIFLALRHFIDGDDAAAVSELKKDTPSGDANRLLAAVLDETGRSKEALPFAQAAVQVAPDDSNARYQLGKVLASVGEWKRATSELRRAVQLGPENAFAGNVLSLVLLQSDASEEAISAAREAIAVSPFNADSHYTLGATLARKPDFVAATDQFAYALMLRPNFPAALSSMRRTLLAAAKTPRGLDEVAATAPDSPELLADVAATYAEAGRSADAIAAGRRSLALARAAGSNEAIASAESVLSTIRSGAPFPQEPDDQ